MSGKISEEKAKEYENFVSMICGLFFSRGYNMFEIQNLMSIAICSVSAMNNIDINCFNMMIDSWKDNYINGMGVVNNILDANEAAIDDNHTSSLVVKSIH